MDIAEFQKSKKFQESKFLKEFAVEGRERAMLLNTKLMEEVGELSDQLLGKYQFQRESKKGKYSKEKYEEELCDVFHMLVLIAEDSGVDLDKVVEKRMQRERRE